MPQIIGVRVHLDDDDHRGHVLHDAGRKFYVAEDGILRITDDAAIDVAVHAAMEWAWAELVHAEPVEMAAVDDVIRHARVDERIDAAEKAVEAAQSELARAQSSSAQTIARRTREIRDAQRYLADLRAELGDAA